MNHKLRVELNTVKNMQTKLGSRWLMLLSFASRHLKLRQALVLGRGRAKLGRAAGKIQAAMRSKVARKRTKMISQVRPLLKKAWHWEARSAAISSCRGAIVLRGRCGATCSCAPPARPPASSRAVRRKDGLPVDSSRLHVVDATDVRERAANPAGQ